MPHAFAHRRRVEFAETDMAGIMHFANYFRFMEATEHAFLRSLGLVVHADEEGGMRGFARVHASCDYTRPLRYGDEVEVHLRVRAKDGSSITYDFAFRLEGDGQDAPPVATGTLRVVCVTRAPGQERLRATRLPADFDRLIEPAPDSPPTRT